MRRILAAACAVLLAGCGDGEDFRVDVAMAPGQARAELARLDGGDFLRALNLPLITTDPAAADALAFTLPGDPHTGTLHLRFEEIGPNATRIHVALDLPEQKTTIRGEPMVLDESLAEASLRKDFESWASRIRQDGIASLDDLNLTLGSMSLTIRPARLTELHAAEDAGTLSRHVDPRYLLGSGSAASDDDDDGPDAFGEPDDAGAPMMDPDSAVANASRPTSPAQGEDPSPDDY